MIHLARCDGFSLFIAFSLAFLPVFFLPVSLQRVRRFCGNWYHSSYVYSVVVVIFFRFAGLFPLSCFPGFFSPFVFPPFWGAFVVAVAARSFYFALTRERSACRNPFALISSTNEIFGRFALEGACHYSFFSLFGFEICFDVLSTHTAPCWTPFFVCSTAATRLNFVV